MTRPETWRDADRRTVLALEPARWPARGAETESVDVGRLLGAVRRQALIVALLAAAGLAVALATLVTTPPTYTAHASILLDSERAELLDLVSQLPSAIVGDASVQSEVEIMKSRELALRVVDRLNLVETPVPLTTPPSILEQATGAAKGAARAALDLVMPEEPAPVTEAAAETPDPRQRLAETLRQNLDVQRVGRSYVFDVAYTAPTPALAAEITNAYARAYLAYQLEASASAGEAAADWLRGRVDSLREASLDATRALDRFRRDNNLVSVGGRLLGEQQISELMSQLILAEADAARADALARQAESAVAGGAAEAARNLPADDSASSSVTGRLLADYTDAVRERRRVVATFGEDHPEAKRLAAEIARLDALIYDALERRLASARNTAEAAQSRVAALRKGLDSALASNATDENVTSRLAQLEQMDESYRQIYQDYLKRLQQAVQRQSVPIVPARIITEADAPDGQASPQKGKVLAIGLFLGLLGGAGIGTLREVRRNRLDSAQDVRALTGTALLGTLPRRARWGVIASRRGLGRRKGRAMSTKVLDAETSRTLRAIKLAVDAAPGRHGCRTVAFAAARTGEGTTTLAILFASMLARHGFATLLIDADPANGTAAAILGGGNAPDLVTLSGEETFDVAALPRPGPEPLTLVRLSPATDPHAGILHAGTARMTALLEAIGSRFDYVVIDSAAASEGADGDALATATDRVVIVNRRRHGTADEVRAMIDDRDPRTVAGVVLNRG